MALARGMCNFLCKREWSYSYSKEGGDGNALPFLTNSVSLNSNSNSNGMNMNMTIKMKMKMKMSINMKKNKASSSSSSSSPLRCGCSKRGRERVGGGVGGEERLIVDHSCNLDSKTASLVGEDISVGGNGSGNGSGSGSGNGNGSGNGSIACRTGGGGRYYGDSLDGFTNGRTPQIERLCVAVDVDEVLGSFLSALNVFVAEKYSLHYRLSQYNVYDFMKIWNCSQAEANERVHAFFESDHFIDGIAPLPGAHQSLVRLAQFCNLVVVTSRQHVIKKQTLDWIEKHYPGVFKEIHFGNHFALEGHPRPKSEICRSINAQFLIDDNPRYAMECAEHGIEVLLFDLHDSYPWSKTSDGPEHPLITRVGSWEEVEQALFAQDFARKNSV